MADEPSEPDGEQPTEPTEGDTAPEVDGEGEATDEPAADEDGTDSHTSSTAVSDGETEPDAGEDVESRESESGRDSTERSESASVKGSLDSESENPDGQAFGEEDSLDPEFKTRFNAAKAEYLELRNISVWIQRKLLEAIPELGFEDSTSGIGVSDFPHRYQDALDRLETRRLELDRLKAHNEEVLTTLQDQYTQADHRRLEREDRFLHMREGSARTSIMSRTNKPIRPTDLNSKESLLLSKNSELEATRIDFIRTRNKHKQTEDDLNKQDQLSEGLHLIDFEQLKIENQSLNEKKAGKNQDLVKIEDKIRVNAHMLTHVKEKLAFVRKQKTSMNQSKQEMEDAYGQARTKLANAKIHRDSVRDENSSLKKSSGLIGMTDLLYDFEARSNELESMQERVSELKTRFNDLAEIQHELEAKIMQRKPIDTSLLKMNR
jgi:hypothetical protein